MVHWMITRLPLLCKNSEAIHLVQPGLTAGWQVVRLADR